MSCHQGPSLSSSSIRSEEHIQSLWAGYGSVKRLYLLPQGDKKATAKDERTLKTLICKKIAPGKGSGIGHARKVRSYRVEAHFYKEHAKKVIASGARVPFPHKIVASKDGSSEFLMEDLCEEFPKSAGGLSFNETKIVLTMYSLPQSSKDSKNDESSNKLSLWDQGGYWYYDTRKHELEGGTDDPDFEDIVDKAEKIDSIMKTLTEQFPTVDKSECALYDFQYCGRSIGARDLAYLLISSCDDSALRRADELLTFYHKTFDFVIECLDHAGKKASSAKEYTLDVLRMHLEYSILDYLRFLAGWVSLSLSLCYNYSFLKNVPTEKVMSFGI
eukprot:jgi/Bigna1/141931/aug1.66_g16639